MAKIRIVGKRRAYILTFDRDDNTDYTKFHNELIAIRGIETWFHYLKSSYVLISKYSASQLNEEINKLVPGKRLLIVELNLKNRNGILPEKAWEWLKTYAQELDDISPNLLM